MFDRLEAWISIRKSTTPVHWLYGAFCAYLIFTDGILLGWLAMGAFAFLEWWNDKEEAKTKPDHLPSGCTDWWDSFVVFIPCHGVVSLLGKIGLIGVTWL